MSNKSALASALVIKNGVMTGTNTLTSSVVDISTLDNIGVQMNFTGTPTGTFAVEVSADYRQDFLGNVLVVGNWIPVALSTPPVASGSAGNIYVDLLPLSAPYLRVQYTNTAGSGVLNVFVTGKTI